MNEIGILHSQNKGASKAQHRYDIGFDLENTSERDALAKKTKGRDLI